MRREDQGLLDVWVAGDLSPERFSPAFCRNWSEWPLHRSIFEYARENGITMLALNVPRGNHRPGGTEGIRLPQPEAETVGKGLLPSGPGL